MRYILKYLITIQEDRIKASGSAVCHLKYFLTTQSAFCDGFPEVIDELIPANVPIKDELLCNAINLNRTRHRTQYVYRVEQPPYPLNFAFITIAFKKGSKLLAFRVHAANKLVDCRKFYNDKILEMPII